MTASVDTDLFGDPPQKPMKRADGNNGGTTMSHELREGVKLRAIFFQDGSPIVLGETVGSITICEQPGQMGMVPWACVKFQNNQPDHLINCALVEGVQLLDFDQ